MKLDQGTLIVIALTAAFALLYVAGYVLVPEDARYYNADLVHGVAAVCALVSLAIGAGSIKSYLSTGYSTLLYLASGFTVIALTNAAMTLAPADGNLFHWYLFFGYAAGLALVLWAGTRKGTEHGDTARVNHAALALLLVVVGFMLFAGLVFQNERELPAMIRVGEPGEVLTASQYFTPFAHLVAGIVLVLAALNTVTYFRLYAHTGQRITMAIATGALLVFESSAFHMVSQPANYFHWLFYALLSLGLLQIGVGYALAYVRAAQPAQEVEEWEPQASAPRRAPKRRAGRKGRAKR